MSRPEGWPGRHLSSFPALLEFHDHTKSPFTLNSPLSSATFASEGAWALLSGFFLLKLSSHMALWVSGFVTVPPHQPCLEASTGQVHIGKSRTFPKIKFFFFHSHFQMLQRQQCFKLTLCYNLYSCHVVAMLNIMACVHFILVSV